jgi:hypothetical protein
MRTGTIVPLSNGLWQDGHCHEQALVRPLTGADEALLHDAGGFILPAERVTILLAAVTLSIGGMGAVTQEVVRRLTIGDRERLLLALYAASFGAEIDLVARCTNASCGERIELPVKLTDLLAAAVRKRDGPDQTIMVAGDSGALRVRFRLPNGADQEIAARLTASGLRNAADRLLARCILSVTDEQDRPVSVEAVLDRLRYTLEDVFRALDPGTDTESMLACPACGHGVLVLLDAFSLLTGEIARSDPLFSDVDRLARVYHWSEADILALPVARRRHYLALLDWAGPPQ